MFNFKRFEGIINAFPEVATEIDVRSKMYGGQEKITYATCTLGHHFLIIYREGNVKGDYELKSGRFIDSKLCLAETEEEAIKIISRAVEAEIAELKKYVAQEKAVKNESGS